METIICGLEFRGYMSCSLNSFKWVTRHLLPQKRLGESGPRLCSGGEAFLQSNRRCGSRALGGARRAISVHGCLLDGLGRPVA